MSLASRTVSFVLVPLFAAALLAQDPAAKKYLLRMAPVAGSEGHYVQSSDMHNAMKMGERTMNMGQSTAMYFTATTKSVEGGKATIEQKYTRVVAKSDNPMGKVDYDSANADSRPGPMAQIAEMIDESVTFGMNDRGKVVETKTSEGFPTDAVEKSGVGLEQSLSQCVPEFPEKEIAVGESWTTTMALPLPNMGEMQCTIVNKLVEVTAGRAKLEQEFQFDTSKLQLPNGAKLEAKKSTGYTILDLATCLPVDSESTMVMDMTAGGGMTMAMSVTSKLARVEPKKEGGAEKTGEQKAK